MKEGGKLIGPISVEIKRSDGKKKVHKQGKVMIKGTVPAHKRGKSFRSVKVVMQSKRRTTSEAKEAVERLSYSKKAPVISRR